MQNFLSFDVSNRAVFMRLVKNKLLAIPTLGFYRFWGKTHLRRLLWQSMRIGEDRLTYHGTAKELFIGFLIAMVLLMIVFGILTFALQLTLGMNEVAAGASQLLNMVLLLLFWQFAKYRLWRYRLSRTSYRTIRFFQSGSALKYTGMVLIWMVGSILTLGWLYPLMRLKLTEYRVNNMAFGDQHFKFDGKAAPFYRLYWPVILSMYAYIILPSALFLTNAENMHSLPNGSVSMQDPFFVFKSIGLGAVLIIVAGLLGIRARVGEYNYVTTQTRFSDAQFAANIPLKRILKVGFVALLVVVAAYGFVATMFGLGTTSGSEFMISLGFLSAFIAFLLVDVMIFMFLFIPVVKLMSEHTYVNNTEVFKDVAASSANSPKYGEGLADALDVGAF